MLKLTENKEKMKIEGISIGSDFLACAVYQIKF